MRGHADAVQAVALIKADDGGAVRVAEDNLSAHINELIHEKQARLEHLLVNEHRAFGLRSHYQKDAEQIGREPRPGMIRDGQDAAVEVGGNLIMLLGRNINVVAPKLQLNPQLPEGIRN